MQQQLLGYLEGQWHREDQGIWEVRGGPRQFTHRKMIAWVAFDRGVRSIESGGLESEDLDASVLLLPLTGFLPATDPRVRDTVAAIERELLDGGFVRRYLSHDGLGGKEGVFLACSFWLADVYSLLGRRDDARALFDKLLALRNDLGLLAEEPPPGALHHFRTKGQTRDRSQSADQDSGPTRRGACQRE